MSAKYHKPSEVQPHYSLRKLSIGVASVLIGTSIYTGVCDKVEAAEPTGTENTTSKVIKSKQDAGDGDAAKDTHAAEQPVTDQLQKPETTNKVDSNSAADQDKPADQKESKKQKEATVKVDASKEKETQSLETKKAVVPVKTLKEEKREERPKIETIDGAHQETVVGELPILDGGLLTPEQMDEYNLDQYRSLTDQQAAITWVKKPNVDNPGTVPAEVELTYTDTSGKKKNVFINVKVDVRPGQKRIGKQIRNRVTYIDVDSGEIVRSFTWLGKQGQTDYGQKYVPERYLEYNTAILLLGYYVPVNYAGIGENNSSLRSLSQASMFSDHDYSATVLVKKLPSDTPWTWWQASGFNDLHGDFTSTNLYYGFLGFGYNDSDKVKDPASYIANLHWLPKGTTVSWDRPPKFLPSGDPDLQAESPVIKVEIPHKGDVLIDLAEKWPDEEGSPIDTLPLRDDFTTQIADDDANLNPTELVSNVNKYNYAKSVLAYLGHETSDSEVREFEKYLFNPKRWSWTVDPDLQKVGWTTGCMQFNPLKEDDRYFHDYYEMVQGLLPDSSNHMSTRLKVVPKTIKKTITRTIIVIDPQGNETTTVQNVSFSGEITDVIKSPKWNPISGEWAEFIAPTYPGYEPSQDKVDEIVVTPNMSGRTIYITYRPIGQPDIPTPKPDPDPIPTPTPKPKPDPKPDVIEKPNTDHTQDNKPGNKQHDDQKTTAQRKTTSNRVSIIRTAYKHNVDRPTVNKKAASLPQTGNKSYAVLGLAALGAAVGLLGLAGLRKRN